MANAGFLEVEQLVGAGLIAPEMKETVLEDYDVDRNQRIDEEEFLLMMCPAEYRLCGHTEAVELFTRWIDSRLRQDEGAQQHGTYTVLSTQGNVGTARNFRGGVRGPGR